MSAISCGNGGANFSEANAIMEVKVGLAIEQKRAACGMQPLFWTALLWNANGMIVFFDYQSLIDLPSLSFIIYTAVHGTSQEKGVL